MEIIPNAKVLKDVMIPMRDGVKLAADVYLPADWNREKLPALLALSTYGKNTQRQLLIQPVPSPLGDACTEAGWTDDIVARGFIHVIACSRGTGQSEGEYLSMYSAQEADDGYDLVEWIAVQDWCDSNVGMLGISYFGTVQLVVGSAKPPHLKAIAPTEATTDQYLACYHGGVLDGFYSELVTGRHSFLSWSGFQAHTINSKSVRDLDPTELANRIAEAKANTDITQYNLFYSILDLPEKNPIFFDIMMNPYDGEDYWWNPDLSKIDIPVLCGCAWYPDCGPKFVRAPFMIWEGVSGPKKMVMWPGGWLDRPFSQYHETILNWFDYWLKGIDNGIMEEPPINLFIQGENYYRDEYEWPLARTDWQDFYLRTHNRLISAVEKYENVPPDAYTQSSLLVTTKIGSQRYTSSPFATPMEVTGPITLIVYLSIDSDDAWIKATLIDVAPDGSERELTHGHLRLSHRELDPERSKPWQPIHKHTRESVKPVVPGEVNEYAVELYPLSNVFKTGHSMALEICSGDTPGKQFSFHVMASDTICYKIYRDAQYPSRLYLPVIPAD
jgi:predicted acyl esterase